MKTKILKKIDNSWFVQFEQFLHRSVDKFLMAGVRWEDIQIFVPDYILTMYERYALEEGRAWWTTPGFKLFRFEGIPFIDNYNNEVAVSCKDIHLRSNLYPQTLLIP